MKKYTRLIVLCLLSSVFCLLAFGQQLAEQLVRIQTDPPTGRVQAFFEKVVTVEGVEYRQPWQQVSWSLGDSTTVPITLADGTQATTTRTAIFAAVQAIAAQEKAAQEAPPAP